MSDHHSSSASTEDDDSLISMSSSSSADVENAFPFASPPRAGEYSTPAASPWSALPSFLLLLAGAILSVMATVALIENVENGYDVDYFHVSSLHVIKNSSLATWDAKLSVNRSEPGFFDSPLVSYESRSWLYSRNGFVSVSSPSMSSGGGRELILRSNFTMKEPEEEEVARDGVLILDLLIEANATHSASGRALYVMIECSGLEIAFAANRSYGEMSGGARRCGAHVYDSKSDALTGSRIIDLLGRLFYYLTSRRDRGMSRVY